MRRAARAIIVKDNQLLVMHRNKFGQEYCALPGGGVDLGEAPEQTLYRELAEETGVTVNNHRLVILEHAGTMYGDQYIYLCDYVSGEPVLAADSAEAMITAAGKNLYEPGWLPIDQLPTANLLPRELSDLLVEKLANGWPDQPIELTIQD
jgi:ADP-ribose pyrophosphatase YjhB (NUDIX family)